MFRIKSKAAAGAHPVIMQVNQIPIEPDRNADYSAAGMQKIFNVVIAATTDCF